MSNTNRDRSIAEAFHADAQRLLAAQATDARMAWRDAPIKEAIAQRAALTQMEVAYDLCVRGMMSMSLTLALAPSSGIESASILDLDVWLGDTIGTHCPDGLPVYEAWRAWWRPLVVIAIQRQSEPKPAQPDEPKPAQPDEPKPAQPDEPKPAQPDEPTLH